MLYQFHLPFGENFISLRFHTLRSLIQMVLQCSKAYFSEAAVIFLNSSLSPHAKRTSSYNPNLVHCYPKMAHMQNVPNECVKISQDGLISTTPLCSFNGNLFPNKAIDNKENKREWKREKSKSYVIKLYM